MLKVLLVDDEPLLLESLEIILSMNQIKVIGMAHDGKEALAIPVSYTHLYICAFLSASSDECSI